MSGPAALRTVLTVALTVAGLVLAHPHPKEARAEQRFITFGWNLTTVSEEGREERKEKKGDKMEE